MNYYEELIEWIKEEKPNKDKLSKKKIKLCKKYKQKHIPTDIEIYLQAKEDDAKLIRTCLQTKPTRTGSGVAVVATMTKPSKCPHGKCAYCPGGPESNFGDIPQSYTGKEPSTMRGIRNNYDPYRIIFNRLEQYIVLGQSPEKVDQIIMGGTFTALPKKYQEEYIYFSFKAYNDFSRLFYKNNELNLKKFKEFFELPGDIENEQRQNNIKNKVLKLKQSNITNLEKEQKKNETVAIRCIGITVETRPDYGFKEQGLELLRLGVTRIELGIQSIYNKALERIDRGHTVEDSIKSISELRDLGFKLNFHMMPGLPGTKIKEDIDGLKEIFSNENFKPDMLKIYPCMVMEGTKLDEFYKRGLFKPLSTDQAADIIVKAKKNIPEYCRIMRIQRDIPTKVTKAGVDKTNLRQYVDQLAKKQNIKCRCIRCREIKQRIITKKPKIITKEYKANNGKEFFISMESDDKILGFIRLRLPKRSLHKSITLKSALIRELHVYGTALNIKSLDKTKTQHKGFGKKLLKKAEDIAKLYGKNKIIIISGVGVREYYKKQGYKKEGPYMIKNV